MLTQPFILIELIEHKKDIAMMHFSGCKSIGVIVCLVALKIGKTIPKKSMGYQIYFLIIFILRTD
jgi:hypothetical protein